MYPSSYGRLWHPGHGIVFSHTRPEDTTQPRVDMLRSLHTTTTDALQTAAVTNNEDSCVHSEDDDAPFSSAPEFQPEPETNDRGNAPLAGVDIIQKKETKVVAQSRWSDLMTPAATTLDFKIPLATFRETWSAPGDSPESFYSYTLYRGPSEEKVKVHYCKSKHTMERVCQYFLKDKMLGFDLEWYPQAKKTSGPRKNVSLIQVANESRIALFHVALFPENDELVSPTFRDIMADPDVSKVGVNIKADCTRLRNHLSINTRGIFELSHLHKLVKYSESGQVDLINRRAVPLATLVKEHLGLPMSKEQNIRSSDWSQALNISQIQYSASDAYAGFQLYHVLEGKRESLHPIPPRPYHAELNLPIRLADGVIIPTADESTEDVENESKTGAPSTSNFKAVRGSIKFEVEEEAVSIAESIQAASVIPPKRFHKDPRVSAADTQLASYRASIKSLRASPSAVRSYYIWRENDDLDPEGIAKILRDPPLQTMTVVSYILESIKLEKLPFDKKRLRNEILHLLPKEVLQQRYKALVREANQPDPEETSSAN